MNLYEYQGKEILKSFGGNVQRGFVTSNAQESIYIAKKLSKETGTKLWVIKAQIHAGGRGKSGGIKLAKSLEEVKIKSSEMLGMKLITPQTGKDGKIVRKIMIAEDVYLSEYSNIKEYYISVIFDRESGKDIIMYSNEGGVDIEYISKNYPKKINIEFIDPIIGIQKFQIRKIAFNLNIEIKYFKEFINFINCLYISYKKSDALLFEINPLLKTSNNNFIAVDTKVIIDDNALFRHNYDCKEEESIEEEAISFGLKFIKLDGNVACMVNGAGLAMATMDMIKLSGGNPANFLDIGGTANVESVENGLNIILKDINVKVILVNIFGGIVRCEIVAKGIVNSYLDKKNLPPIIIRLQGTNFESAKEILNVSGIFFYSVNTLHEASMQINKILFYKK